MDEVKASSLPQLPDKYYLDYFYFLLTYIKKYYYPLLTAEENRFLSGFENLTKDSQCLFVRLANRRGRLFREDKLNYKEINSISACINELQEKGFVTLYSRKNQFDLKDVFKLFSSKELLERFNLKKNSSFLTKESIINFIINSITSIEIMEALNEPPIIKQEHQEEIEFFKFLFTGHLDFDMSAFVVKDLGNIKYQNYDEDLFLPIFSNRQEIDDTFYMAQNYRLFKEYSTEKPGIEIYHWLQALNIDKSSMASKAVRVYEKINLKLGTILEKDREYESAISLYNATSIQPARERLVRTLWKTGRKRDALELCNQMTLDYTSFDEKTFALDFIRKNQDKKSRKSVTEALEKAEVCTFKIDNTLPVEISYLNYLQAKGYGGFFSENYLWRGFFGLLFWDLIFNQENHTIHHPFQFLPSEIYSRDFFELNKEILEGRAEVLYKKNKFKKLIKNVWVQKYGTANGLFPWYEDLLDHIYIVYSLLEPEQIKAILFELAKDLKQSGVGFPDVFVFKKNEYYFAEVKSVNDKLSPQQLAWLNFFNSRKINIRLVRVLNG